MPLKQNDYVNVRDEVVIAAKPPRRHRAFPTAVRLPDGDILVDFRLGSDQHMTHERRILPLSIEGQRQALDTAESVGSVSGMGCLCRPRSV